MVEISEFMGRAYAEVWSEMERNGWEMAGPPFAFYRSWSEGQVDMDCGFPVRSAVKATGRVRSISLPSVRAAKALHVGPYMELVRTYTEVGAWIREKGFEPADQMWEFYLNDPKEVPPDKLLTEIIWPIR